MPMPMPILMPRYQCRDFQMALKSWKWGTLRTVIKRAYVICSTSNLLLDHILFVFQKYNNFPKWVIDQALHQEKENHHVVRRVQPEINEVSNEKSHIWVLPYARQKGERLIKGFTLTLTDGLVFKDLNTQNNYSATKNVYVHMCNSLKIIKAF